MNNRQGIPCFVYYEIGQKNEKTIRYDFVSGDTKKPLEIPLHATVSLGDMDPKTGELITDLTFFRESRELHNHEVYLNKKARSVPLTDHDKAVRKEIRKKLAEDYESDFGYPPSKKVLDDLMFKECSRSYRLELDALKMDHGKPNKDRSMLFEDRKTVASFRKAENGGIDPLDAFAETLDDREREMFEMLQMKAEGYNMCGMINFLADKWGLEQYKVSRMKTRIGLKLIKYLKEVQ